MIKEDVIPVPCGRRLRLLIWITIVVGLVASILLIWRSSYRRLRPLEVSFWYWHKPFRLSPEEVMQLNPLGVQQLFVRAGTFSKAGQGIALTMPQEWHGPVKELRIHLVFNFDYGIVRSFERLSNETIDFAVRAAVRKQQKRAEEAGVKVAGLQLDFDCPTRLLPKYADLLHRIKSAIRNLQPEMSITALPTWFTSPEIQRVIDEVDFYVPQYYEARVPRKLDEFAPVSCIGLMERGMKAAARSRKAFYVGLPAYGHALVYDDGGKLLGTYRDLSAPDAARSAPFRLSRSFPSDAHGKPATRQTWIGEDIVDLIAPAPGSYGRGRDYHVIFDLPTPEVVRQHLAMVRSHRPRNCRGVILFRYPEAREGSEGPGETMTLPLASLTAAIRGGKAQPRLKVQLVTANAPWELIETGRRAHRVPVDLAVTVTNVGSANTFLASDAVTLTLYFDRPGLEEVEPGGFDGVETFFDDLLRNPKSAVRNPMRSSPRRANAIRFSRIHLGTGESAKAGPMRISADGASKVWGEWRAVGPGGFETAHGEIEKMTLTR